MYFTVLFFLAACHKIQHEWDWSWLVVRHTFAFCYFWSVDLQNHSKMLSSNAVDKWFNWFKWFLFILAHLSNIQSHEVNVEWNFTIFTLVVFTTIDSGFCPDTVCHYKNW